MLVTLNFGTVKGLHPAEQQQLRDLADVFNYHQSSNTLKDKYYEGHITLKDVNLGIALPNALSGLEGGAHVFFSNSILVGAFSVVILKALIIDLPNFIARHADERTKQAE